MKTIESTLVRARLPLVLLGLGLLAGASAPLIAQTSSDDLVFRRIWTSRMANVPDLVPPAAGRYLAGTDWTTGDLAFFDLQRDEMHRLTDKGSWMESDDMAMGTLISAGGEWIAYQWHHLERETGGEVRLGVIRRDGTGSRTLRAVAQPYWLEPVAWIPDGTGILVRQMDLSERRSGAFQLVLVSTEDGSSRVLEEFDGADFSKLFVSPDGRFAAYDSSPEASTDADIYAIALDGGESRALVRGNGDDRLMGWDPDGSGIFFYSNRELTRAIWRLPVADGRAAGEPELVRGDVWDLVPMGFSGNRYYYAVIRKAPQVRTAVLDIAAGEVVTPPTVIRDPSEGWSRDPAWSPDGNYLAFLDFGAGVPLMANQARLGIRAVHTGETRYLPYPFPGFAQPRWLPDGNTLTVVGRYGDSRGIHQLDLQSGEVTTIWEREEGDGEAGIGLSPDGETYYFHRNRSEIYSRDIRTGRETLLGHAPGVWRRIAVSPDGETLGLRISGPPWEEDTRILAMPAGGGEPREIYRGELLKNQGFFLEITPDSRYVIAAGFGDRTVWRFPMEGGEPVKLLEGETPRSFTLSPDGRRIAYWDMPEPEGAMEIWVIEGLTEAGGGR